MQSRRAGSDVRLPTGPQNDPGHEYEQGGGGNPCSVICDDGTLAVGGVGDCREHSVVVTAESGQRTLRQWEEGDGEIPGEDHRLVGRPFAERSQRRVASEREQRGQESDNGEGSYSGERDRVDEQALARRAMSEAPENGRDAEDDREHGVVDACPRDGEHHHRDGADDEGTPAS